MDSRIVVAISGAIATIIAAIINIPAGIILTIIAIGIAIFIALTQQKQLKTQQIQLKKLEDIGNQTKETTIKLGTESRIREIVNNFFALKDKDRKKNINFFFQLNINQSLFH